MFFFLKLNAKNLKQNNKHNKKIGSKYIGENLISCFGVETAKTDAKLFVVIIFACPLKMCCKITLENSSP
jgi:hypothetical protein